MFEKGTGSLEKRCVWGKDYDYGRGYNYEVGDGLRVGGVESRKRRDDGGEIC